MTKRMLIDDTRPEETRVVIVNGNKVEDVEFESASRKQIKGNIYLAKVMRVEPSLQAAFVDYGGNKHGFLAFGEIHPDYYNVSEEELASIDKEVDEIIEAKKQAIKEREAERERHRAEKAAQYAAREEERKAREAAEAEAKAAEAAENGSETSTPVQEEAVTEEKIPATETTSAPNESLPEAAETTAENGTLTEETPTETVPQEETAADSHKHPRKKRILKKRARKAQQAPKEEAAETEPAAPEQEKAGKEEKLTVMAESTKEEEETVQEEVDAPRKSSTYNNMAEEDVVEEDDDEEDDSECDFEIQRKLMKIRKLFHRSKIQDVIKEGQILLVQVVKEERGNKGAACTTYLSLAGRYCVLMPNRIKSGGVSRKITNPTDRRRLKDIVKNLPLTTDMSLIIRTAGEEKNKAEIVRDYNYLIRAWNQIRINALKNKAPCLIFEEGNLIKRALRDMFTKDISEVVVDGDNAFKTARDFIKILSPHSLKKVKCRKPNEMPVFQRFQVESQLDKLHNPVVQLESGGYLVINPTEALVSIDVNSGRATREKDIEETALKTNLEAADEIAKQLRMRNLAGLVVVDFIDMDDPKNNTAVEKRMKEALKNDRSRIQVAKMSCFGLLEISRQRIHSSFMESNYEPCPFCHGQGVIRTTESGAMLILRALEEEGVKNRSSKITVFVPTDTAVYLLNQKRKMICDLEDRYRLSIIISADNSIKNISDYRLERVKFTKQAEPETENTPAIAYAEIEESEDLENAKSETEEENTFAEKSDNDFDSPRNNRRFKGRRNRFDRRRNSIRHNNNDKSSENSDFASSSTPAANKNEAPKKETKVAWWRKLIG